MARWNIALIAALLGLSACLPALAQWKWRDKNGQTQYSDLPPPAGVAEQDILQRPSPSARRATAPAAPASAASGAPLLAPRASDPELEARRKKAAQDAADKKAADDAKTAAAKADNCSHAKDALRALESGARVTRTNASGEREFLDDAERAKEADRARSIVASQCS
jgi:hypothetical protein